MPNTKGVKNEALSR